MIALVILGAITLISVPVYQTMVQWRSGYLQIIKRERTIMEAHYRAWLARDSN